MLNTIVNYCCTSVLLYAKMLKETEAEETAVVCDIFIMGSILIGGEPGPPLVTHMT